MIITIIERIRKQINIGNKLKEDLFRHWKILPKKTEFLASSCRQMELTNSCCDLNTALINTYYGIFFVKLSTRYYLPIELYQVISALYDVRATIYLLSYTSQSLRCAIFALR